MESCTDQYLDYITDLANSMAAKPFIVVEKKLIFLLLSRKGSAPPTAS